MPLRIGFDMDGVVADLNAALGREARQLFPGLNVEPAARDQPQQAPPASGASAEPDPAEIVPASLHLTARQQRQLWDAAEAKSLERAKAGGAQIVEVEREAFRQAMAPVYARFVNTPELQRLVKSIQDTK